MKIFLIIYNVLLIMSLLLWPMFLIGSAFAFDSPGSENSFLTKMFVFSIAVYPVAALVGGIGFWMALKKNSLSMMKLFSCISAISPILVVCSIILLTVVCGGQFSCRI